MKFIHYGEDGKELAVLAFEQDFDRKYKMQQFCANSAWDKIPSEVWLSLIRKALAEAGSKEVEEIEFRLVETPNSSGVSAELPAFGFERGIDRTEFRVNLDTLPSDIGTPFTWQPLSPIGAWSMRQAADLLKVVSDGDPDANPNEDPLKELESDLDGSFLSGGPECVNIGLVDGEPVAVVIAQINPKTKWSRITYMGLSPSHRGTGLGAWVHRHGFEMLRLQGGVLYHGGTTSDNIPMLKLFEANGCPLYRRMQQWKCKL